MDRILVTPIGYVRSSLKDPGESPRQGRDAATQADIEILPGFEEALRGIEEWSQLQVTCWLHLAPRGILKVHPKGQRNRPLTGVFATRSPARPNPLGVYTADLLEVRGRTLRIRGIDAVDGTPVLDIKPHIHRLDD